MRSFRLPVRGSHELERLVRPPVREAGSRWSAVVPGEASPPSPALVDLLLRAAAVASRTDLAGVAQRCRDGATERWVSRWPGEHYRLLAGIVQVLEPACIVELGTFQGHSALSLLAGSPDTRVITYDLVPWRAVPGSVLREQDFAQGRLEQRIGDVSLEPLLTQELPLLKSADLLFVDGPKDGRFEQRFVERVLPQLADRPRIVVFDDIRLLPMADLWNSLPQQHLDATSLGHWSGTGLVQTC